MVCAPIERQLIFTFSIDFRKTIFKICRGRSVSSSSRKYSSSWKYCLKLFVKRALFMAYRGRVFLASGAGGGRTESGKERERERVGKREREKICEILQESKISPSQLLVCYSLLLLWMTWFNRCLMMMMIISASSARIGGGVGWARGRRAVRRSESGREKSSILNKTRFFWVPSTLTGTAIGPRVIFGSAQPIKMIIEILELKVIMGFFGRSGRMWNFRSGESEYWNFRFGHSLYPPLLFRLLSVDVISPFFM